MTTIHSLPLELLHLIFHWATYDYAIYASGPSWKHYNSTSRNCEDPWPTLDLDTEREETAKALRLTCTRWTALATQFELYYLSIDRIRKVEYYLSRIRKPLQKDAEGGHKVRCPVRFINLSMRGGPGGFWSEEDTEMVVSLLRDCPNLEVMVNTCSIDRETHAAGPIILQSLVNSCPKLKRLHWKPEVIMQLRPSSWSSILASTSLATSLEFLEIMDDSFATADEPTPALGLKLPSLQCLQLSVDDGNSSLASVIAEDWELPSLTSLYLQSTYGSTFTLQNDGQTTFSPSTTSLISTHGQTVATLAIDSSTAYYMPLHILPPAPIQELVYYIYPLGKSTSIPFPALSTLVLINLGGNRDSITDIWCALEGLHILKDHSLPKLKKVVVLSLPLEELEEPYPIDLRLLDETERRLVEPWQHETPILVNQDGVRLFTLVGTDQG